MKSPQSGLGYDPETLIKIMIDEKIVFFMKKGFVGYLDNINFLKSRLFSHSLVSIRFKSVIFNLVMKF